MTIIRTRKRLAWAIAGLATTLTALGGMLIYETGQIFFMRAVPLGCACAAPSALTPWNWINGGVAFLFTVGLVVGLISLILTFMRTRRLLRALAPSRPTDEFVLFHGKKCEAFTFGLIRPQIAICAHCVATLPPAELAAMLIHEQQHVRRRDPLKFLILNTLQSTFFFVPLLRNLVAVYRTMSELEADEAVPDRVALGEALLRLVPTHPSLGTLASFALVIEIRMERLSNPAWRPHVSLHVFPLLLAFVVIGGSWGTLHYTSHLNQDVTPRLCSQSRQCLPGTQSAPPFLWSLPEPRL